MVKRLVLAILWALVAWMWIAIAHVFLGTPDLSLLGSLLAVVAVAATGYRPAERHPGIGRAHIAKTSAH